MSIENFTDREMREMQAAANLRTRIDQVGGITDGITPEAAQEQGIDSRIMDLESLLAIRKAFAKLATENAADEIPEADSADMSWDEKVEKARGLRDKGVSGDRGEPETQGMSDDDLWNSK